VSSTRGSVRRLNLKISPSFKPLLIKDKSIPRGSVMLSGDKSIAHRALILSALSCGKTLIKNFPLHDDALATLKALSALGVEIELKENSVSVFGRGRQGLVCPQKPVFVNNSGTTLRLLLGVLAGMDFETKVIAGKYLSRRPMSRVNFPLRLMGARITARNKGKEEYAPLVIKGGNLKGIVYQPEVASAQVKSAILLAGLFASGKTRIYEKISTRDHTERMLKIFRAKITLKKPQITLSPGLDLVSPGKIFIPGDISSAAFFMVLASIIPGSRVVVKFSSLNSGRIGIIKVLKRMGVKIKIIPIHKLTDFEPSGDIIINGSKKLKATIISSAEIPSLIDELPILMVAACFAQGTTVIKDAGELRVKETDRINSMVYNLKKMGADIRVEKDGLKENILIKGQGELHGTELKSFADHRIAMSMVVAALAASGRSRLDDIGCINKSFPDFLSVLKSLAKR
jgi:3-phosphoshikimate 1-carboxyvinyltransferase